MKAGHNLAMIFLYFQYLFMKSDTKGKLELISSIVPRVALACVIVLMSSCQLQLVDWCEMGSLRQFLWLLSNPSTATYCLRTSSPQSFGVRGLTEHPRCRWWSSSFHIISILWNITTVFKQPLIPVLVMSERSSCFLRQCI